MKSKGNESERVPLVCDLDLERYLGKWYEIGKLPARAQMGLKNVTAIYSFRSDGRIRVQNTGFRNGKKKGITGTAWQRQKDCSGALHVRFFWPFKGEYNVIRLASDYRYAVVMGDSKSSLWILSRTPELKKEDARDILRFLIIHGFDVQRIIRTRQDRNYRS